MRNKKQEALWLEARTKGIGGSDASCVVGRNPYKTNIQLWEEKTGRVKAKDISDNKFVNYGKEAEKPLRELFKLDFPGLKVEHQEFRVIHHPKYDFLLASLDGELTDIGNGAKGILEIKTTEILNSMHKEKWTDAIPDNYYIQVLHYLLVTGYSFAILKAQLKTVYDGEIRLNTRHYRIDREQEVEDDIRYLLEQEIRFWTEYVVPDKVPPLILPPI